MQTVTSADGTSIAYERLGGGPPIVLIAGAFNDRRTTAPLAAQLQARFEVFNYDRRGRGDSTDADDYEVARELGDLAAVIELAGGAATVFGYSSGAVLAIEAAAAELPITALVLYEPPFLVDGSRPRPGADLADRLAALIAEGRRGDAVELYQSEGIGLPEEAVTAIRSAPFRPGLEAIAHTLVYDAAITGDLTLPTEKLARIQTPALLLEGDLSWPFLRAGTRAAAEALPQGEITTLAGQSHDIDPEVTAAAIEDGLNR